MARLGLKFVRNEVREWIEAGFANNWLVNPKRWELEKFWPRVSSSKIGYTLHCLGHVVGWHTSLIFDPLNSGGFFSHMQSFFWNLWHVDIWWPICHRIDEWRRPEYHRQQRRFMQACMQAQSEGCADPMPPPDGFPADRFHGAILGKRYFERVAEILEQDGPAEHPWS